jgi:methanogenic corrinoid protein MtbC1
VLIGGQPINRSPEMFRAIGADMTASDAREAVQRAMEAFSNGQ